MPNIPGADDGFLDRVAAMIGGDAEEVSTKIEELDSVALMDLTDAVANGDDQAVRDILGMESGDEGSETDDLDVEADRDEKDHEDGEKGEAADGPEIEVGNGDGSEDDMKLFDAVFAEGERVRVGLSEGVVEIANGPYDTIGIRIEGRLRMVEKARVKRLNERLMAMTVIPDLKRMQQLAGIPGGEAAAEAEATIEVEKVPELAPGFKAMMPPGPVMQAPSGGESAKVACAALDQLERTLPDVRVGEFSPIRKRLYDLMSKLNESEQRAVTEARPKKKKAERDSDPCWNGYEMVGMKKKGDREVPNCVPKNESAEPRKTLKDYLKHRR